MVPSDYASYLRSIVDAVLHHGGKNPALPPLVKPPGFPDQPKILMVSPHPDDECLMAGYALRAQEEWGAEVHVVPFSYGSNTERRPERLKELKAALEVLRFRWVDPRTDPFLNRLTMTEFVKAYQSVQPDVILSPHPDDHHPAHIAAANMVRDLRVAMKALSAKEGISKKEPIWIQTEYWKQNAEPDYFLPLSADHVICMGRALQKHEGEISRNPYHLSLPAWLMDQSRRAQEVMGAYGEESAQHLFGVLLKIQD